LDKTLERARNSDVLRIETVAGQIYGLSYVGCGAFGQWSRLSAYGEPTPLVSRSPSTAALAAWSVIEGCLCLVGFVLFFLQAAFDGWHHTDSSRRR
jgi:hypothetical protein